MKPRKKNKKRKNKNKGQKGKKSKTSSQKNKAERKISFSRIGRNGKRINGTIREARNGKEDYSGDGSGGSSGNYGSYGGNYGSGSGSGDNYLPSGDNYAGSGSGNGDGQEPRTGPDRGDPMDGFGPKEYPSGSGGSSQESLSSNMQDGNIERNGKCLKDSNRLNGKKGLILGWGKDDDNEKSDVLR